MGGYVLNTTILSITMGVVNVVLVVQWLQSLGAIDIYFQECLLKIVSEGNEIELKGITRTNRRIIYSNGMNKPLKKEQ